MFKLATTEKVWTRVIVPIAIDYGGKEERQFGIEFTRITDEEEKLIERRRGLSRLGSKAIKEWIEDKRITEDEAKVVLEMGPLTDREIIENYTVGWKNVCDASGVEIPFSKETLAQLLNIYPTELCIIKAFFVAQGKAEKKN